jgi:hypothetical protein
MMEENIFGQQRIELGGLYRNMENIRNEVNKVIAL